MKNKKIELADDQHLNVSRLIKNHINDLKTKITDDADRAVIKSFEGALHAFRIDERKEAKKKLARIETALNAQDITPKFYAYSGRFMYGRNCVGVNVDRYEYSELCKNLKKRKINFTSDNMGMDMVVYFTNIDWEDVKGDISTESEDEAQEA